MVSDTILVTGGLGFIGSNFISHWLQEVGDPVVNLDKLTYAGNLSSLEAFDGDSRYQWVKADIGDEDRVAALLEQHQPRAIVNLAAETHVDRSIDAPDAFVQTNIVGVHRLLRATLQYWRALSGVRRERFRFLHVSTDEVYGSLERHEAPFTESSPHKPNSPYAASKASADHLVRAYHRTYGLPTLTTNSSNNYGPYQFPEKLIPLMILNAQAGTDLPLYGDGLQVRDWLYVGDHCRGLQAVLEAGRVGETYSIGGECEKSNREVVEAVCSLIDEVCPGKEGGARRSLIRRVADRPGHDRRYAIDTTKVRSETGWRPIESFDSGLGRTVRWYLEHSAWCESTRASYRGERLGLEQTAIA